jgi:hypothetical protein
MASKSIRKRDKQECQLASSVSALRPSQPHLHIPETQCPVCDQPIPNEKAQQVRARMEARERQLTDVLTTRLKEQFAAERVQIEANARASIEQANRENNAKLEREIAAIRSEAAQKEAAARAEGAKAGQAAAQAEIDELKQASTAAQREIETLKQANADVNAVAQQKVAEAERLKTGAETAARDRITAAEAGKAAAEADATAVREQHEAKLNERLQEQREALEKDKTAALNARDAKHFEENQKLKEKLDEVQRKLDKKTSDDLGEGGEVDLFEELRAHFEGDRVRRVPKGTPGADIIHEIVEDGRLCGKIVYDSKKRASWKTEYATKLCEDKIAEGADHAILSLMKFPAECRQLEIRDGVILANPARVSVLAEIFRDHVVRSYGLRLSNEEREKKTHELYTYITSERFHQHMDSIEKQTDKLLDIDVAEEKAHRKVWETRGGFLKSLQKAHGNLRADVARIIGTTDSVETS